MGACYSVNVKVHIVDETGAVKALNEHIANDTGTRYNLEKYAASGITTETFDGLMKILLADAQQELYITKKRKYTTYDSCFNASYGWECVMIEWFHVLAPFLSDGSQMLIYPDEDYDKLVIRNGKCVQIH